MKKIFVFVWITLFLYQSGILANDYKGGEYRTKKAFLYGRFEARYKPPKGDGFLASFFTYHEITSSTKWNEIDFEILGRYDHDVQVTSIGPGQKIRKSHQWVPFNTHEDFHNYAFEWTPDYIAWFIDGIEVYRQDQAHIADFQYEQKIMMNIWPPTWEPWVGKLDDRMLPVFSFYDWVSYASYTPGIGNVGTGTNFTLQWKDDFDNWDQDRWEKATHTFSGNNCDFMPENVVFKDGHLILCLTKPAPLGFVDFSPPAIQWARVFQDRITIGFTEELEPASAQKASNYIISGHSISEAKLLQDGRTVLLTVLGLDPASSYNLIALGIRDNSSARNLMPGQVINLTKVKPLTFPLKINVGGPAVQDFLPDQIWSPELEYGHQDGYEELWPATIDVKNTDLDSIYLTELHELVYYKIRVPNGLYRITLMMAENQHQEPGNRLFDIHVENRLLASGIDLTQQVGAHTAHEIAADPIEITDEMIDIHFTNRWGFSLLNGIVVEQLNTAIEDDHSAIIPGQLQLLQNYPNPFNASTTIDYHLPSAGLVNLTIFNSNGQKIKELINQVKPAGRHRINWQPQAASGIYFYQIEFASSAQRYSECRKMILMR